jgi:hypothetical protein
VSDVGRGNLAISKLLALKNFGPFLRSTHYWMSRGSDYLPRHFWPSPSIFPFIAIFFCLCVPPFLVPLSVFFAQKFCLHESLFLDKKLNQSCFLDKISNQIDSLILYLIVFIYAIALPLGGWQGRWLMPGGGRPVSLRRW